MAEEKQQLQGIDWQETFAFTNVFRSFRLAVHPSKLVLALVGLALCFVAGLVLDGLWYGGDAIIWEDKQPIEIKVFAEGGYLSRDFADWYEHKSELRLEKLKRTREQLNLKADDANIKSAGIAGILIDEKLDRLEDYIKNNRLEKQLDKIAERYPRADQEDQRRELQKEAEERVPKQILAKRRAVYEEIEGIRDLVGTGPAKAKRGPFKALMIYELGVFNELIQATARRDLLGGLSITSAEQAGPVGIVGQLWRALKGLQWLLWQHWLYFVVYGVICLVVWAIFGGAISRIAALHVARDEKISMKQALNFSIKKFPSFVFAPLIPAVIVAVLGLLVVVGVFILFNWGLGIGEVLNSVLFFLPLIAGFVMALVAVGTVGGLDLMYPTIAVEGSDSFDAISRSFSYVYARPWRMAFYSLVALVYGALCYLFVRFFAFLVLKLAHIAVSLGVVTPGHPGIADKFNTMWPGPRFESLHGGFDWGACWGAQAFGAWVIGFWVYVIIGFVAAFLVSFFFSANTVIYYLLRKRVDATDMDDVYVEEEPTEEVPPVPAEEPAKAEEAESEE